MGLHSARSLDAPLSLTLRNMVLQTPSVYTQPCCAAAFGIQKMSRKTSCFRLKVLLVCHYASIHICVRDPWHGFGAASGRCSSTFLSSSPDRVFLVRSLSVHLVKKVISARLWSRMSPFQHSCDLTFKEEVLLLFCAGLAPVPVIHQQWFVSKACQESMFQAP